jgi:TET-Associated Glycosyltransferase
VELWVQERDREIYDLYWDGVHVLPPHITRLGPTREFLCRRYRGEKLVLLDDDLSFYWRVDPADWHLTTPPPHALEQMFREVEDALDSYAHVGISGREGQNREPAYAVECTRYMRFLAYNTAMWPEHITCDRLDGMSDFDTNMQLLRAGLPSRVFYRWAQGQRSTQTPGGCSLYRTHDTHAAEVASLCELHPGLVTPRYKVNKSGGVFGHRDEVTVGWQLALGWDARKGRVDSPTELMARDLADLRIRHRVLESQCQEMRQQIYTLVCTYVAEVAK